MNLLILDPVDCIWKSILIFVIFASKRRSIVCDDSVKSRRFQPYPSTNKTIQ